MKESRIVKYNHGDILHWKFKGELLPVVLLRRWDRNSKHRTAWIVRDYPNGESEFAVPEDELFPIEPSKK